MATMNLIQSITWHKVTLDCENITLSCKKCYKCLQNWSLIDLKLLGGQIEELLNGFQRL